MKNIANFLVLFFFFLTLNIYCKSQDKNTSNCNITRQAVVAGKFYESDNKKLSSDLTGYFKNAIQCKSKNVLAIIAPHAGYLFSAPVAASAFNQIDTEIQYKRVFIIAPSHYFAFDGGSVYNQGNYATPLGQVEVDCDFANELIDNNPVFKFLPQAHDKEHAIEVQLPFIQTRLKKGFKIVPIVIGTQDNRIIKQISKTLKKYLTAENLFVISSDFSHYPAYTDAVNNDKKSAMAITKNSPDVLMKQLRQNESENINDLATSMCGEAGIMCLLYMSSELKNTEYQLIDYKNSGDSEYGSKDRVVGYWAIVLVDKNNDTKTSIGFEISKEDKKALLSIARETLDEYIKKDKIKELDTTGYSNILKTKCGAFVTLTAKGELRGCIGSFAADKPIYQVVQDMSISASSNDPRFEKVKPAELKNIEIEISVLSPMQKIDSISQIEVGKHGIYIKNGFRRGTLLPQVATDNKWNREQFVKYCAMYKAGIPEEEIKNSELFIYEAIVFNEKEND